ncbi:MAG TPA: response regulator [Candidatus Angelobacter sp.]|nr:response regulator [Candidatus Angelobacter sp.]
MSKRDENADQIVALVVDDSAASLKTRTQLLQASGFTVFGATTFDTALRAVDEEPVDIIVTDINLDPKQPTDKSGIDFARRVRHLNQRIPIVGYSAFFAENELTPTELKVFDTYLPKGAVGIREIAQHISNWRVLAASYRILRKKPSFDPLNLLRPPAPELLLYSANTWLAYNIAQRFFGGRHYVWCTPDFDAEAKPGYTATVPPSSSPKEIYRTLREAVRFNDRHNDKIKANIAGILRGAELWRKAGDITIDQYEEIKATIDRAQIAEFRPLLYVIRRDLVEHMLVQVPVDQKAATLAPEFIIERLPSFLFEVLQPY